MGIRTFSEKTIQFIDAPGVGAEALSNSDQSAGWIVLSGNREYEERRKSGREKQITSEWERCHDRGKHEICFYKSGGMSLIEINF
jgi:hypothetical protein